MNAVEKSTESGQPRAMLSPLLPLVLLESMRSHDRPRELLEDEDLALSMPRRLGLTGVVESQIVRYEAALRRGRPVPAEDALDLLRLILKRPDAEPILREAGRLAAHRQFARMPAAMAAILGILPRAVRFAAARKAVRNLLRRLDGSGRLEVAGKPLVVRRYDPLVAAVDATGTACVSFGSAIEELVSLYTRKRPRVSHSACTAKGQEYCEWTLAE